MFDNEVRERFIVFWINNSNVITRFEVISEGILNSSLVHPREVFRGGIVTTCANIILAHNHLSGNLEASQEDIQMTKQLVDEGNIVGIKLYDHIILAENAYMSFVEKRMI